MLKHFPGRLFVALVPTGVFIALVLNAGIAVAAVSPGGDIRAQENRATRVSELINILRHPDEAGRAAAAEALGRIGPMAAAAVPMLAEALGAAPEPGMRWAAAFALGGIGPAAAAAVPVLAEVLRTDPEAEVRAAAAAALGGIGPAAAAALAEALRGALESGVRRAAVEALGRIGLGIADRVEAPERNDPRLQGVA